MRAKGEPKVLNTALRYTWDKARTAPNVQNRKSLNFQDKIDGKSKVSKPIGVETAETAEVAEVTQAGTRKRKLRLWINTWPANPRQPTYAPYI